GEDRIRVAVQDASVRVVRLLVAGDVVLVAPASVRLEAGGAAEALAHEGAEGRGRNGLSAQSNGHVGPPASVERDRVRSRRPVAGSGRVRRQPGHDPCLDAFPETRDRAAGAGTLRRAADEDAWSRAPAPGLGDVEAALGPKGEVARVVEVAHDDRPRRSHGAPAAAEGCRERAEPDDEPN